MFHAFKGRFVLVEVLLFCVNAYILFSGELYSLAGVLVRLIYYGKISLDVFRNNMEQWRLV